MEKCVYRTWMSLLQDKQGHNSETIILSSINQIQP
jgi:hypothetical protein